MNRLGLFSGVLAAALLLVAAGWLILTNGRRDVRPDPPATVQHVVVNEAVRTVLYLPVYHAIRQGYFRDEGLDVEIITGGTATNAFSAMLSGEADFAVADPMYVPISRESGGATVVVGQLVGRIAVWALSRDAATQSFDRSALEGKTVSTHQRPMTAYTYTENHLRGLGLVDGENVTIMQNRPGSEVNPFLAGRSDFVVTLEPGASVAEAAGAHVVYSWPAASGERIFTGLMARSQTVAERREIVIAFLAAIQRSLGDIRRNRSGALITAREYFPAVEPAVLERAIARLIDEQVIPNSVEFDRTSWQAAVSARREAGDLRSDAPFEVNVASDLWREVPDGAR